MSYEFCEKNDVKQTLKEQNVENDYLFSTCVCVNEKLFSFTSFKQIPIVADLHTKEIIILNDLKNYDSSFMADPMINDGENIFVLELNGKRLMKYNIKAREYQYYKIDCDKGNWGNYASFVKYKRYLYIFPTYTDGIVRFNIESGKVQRYKQLYSEIMHYNKDLKQQHGFLYCMCGCQVENIMWLFQKQGNLVVSYNMEDNTWKKYILPVSINHYVDVKYSNNYFYILNSEGIIYCWNVIDNSIDLVADCSNTKTDVNSFSRIIVIDKRIFLLPLLGKEIFIIDLITKEIKRYTDYPSEFRYCEIEGWSKYYGYCEDNEHYYFAMRSTNYILSLNKQDGKIVWIKFKFPSYIELIKKYIYYNKHRADEIVRNLNDLIIYIDNDIIENQIDNYHLLGTHIWRKIKLN